MAGRVRSNSKEDAAFTSEQLVLTGLAAAAATDNDQHL